MVSSADSPEPKRSGLLYPWLTGIFVILAMLGLWWAQIQQRAIDEITGSLFEFPSGRWILWSLTLIAVGLLVGLAVAAGSGWRQRIRPSALLWAVIPLAMIVSFHLFIAGVTIPRAFLEVLVGIQMQVASAITIGVFLAGLLAPVLPTPKPGPSD